MNGVTSIGSLSSPQFSVGRQAYTGSGWFFGATHVRFDDGTMAVHASFAFPTKAEADEAHRDLKKKLS